MYSLIQSMLHRTKTLNSAIIEIYVRRLIFPGKKVPQYFPIGCDSYHVLLGTVVNWELGMKLAKHIILNYTPTDFKAHTHTTDISVCMSVVLKNSGLHLIRKIWTNYEHFGIPLFIWTEKFPHMYFGFRKVLFLINSLQER